jgi:hypothetical protein
MGNRFPFAKRWIFLTFIFTIFASEALAWGEEGHSIVAEIAQRRLSQSAAQAITPPSGSECGSLCGAVACFDRNLGR